MTLRRFQGRFVADMGFVKQLKANYDIIKERDPAIKSYWEVLLYPYFWAMRSHRRAHLLYERGHFFRARRISQRAAKKTGIEIHPGAVIGKGFFIDHGEGVVIGETTVIGNNVTIYQGVTLGGTGKETGKRHPTLQDNVMVSTGAKLLGSFTVGENSKIGAGSVVLEDVPPDSTVVGVPGRVVRRNNQKVAQTDLNHADLPDPIMDCILCIEEMNANFEVRITALEKEKEKERERERT
jgi:serine O-acetyltransferase